MSDERLPLHLHDETQRYAAVDDDPHGHARSPQPYEIEIPDTEVVQHEHISRASTPSSHCHNESSNLKIGVDKVARKQLIIASLLCLLFMIGETVGGAIAGSLAIMTDAAHLLTDFASFMISLLAIYLSSRPATKRMLFGWARAEVVGALVSVLMIWEVTGVLVYLAIERIRTNKYEINGKVMLITSGVGVAVNIIMAFVLHQQGASGGHGHSHSLPFLSVHSHKNSDSNGHGHGHRHGDGDGDGDGHGHGHGHGHGDGDGYSNADSDGHGHGHGHDYNGDHEHEIHSEEMQDVVAENGSGYSSEDDSEAGIKKRANINVRAAFIHVIGDFLQSVGVMVASLIIFLKPEYKIADPICTFVFSVLVLLTTLAILKDTMLVLMEGSPSSLDFNEVKASLYAIEGVRELHDLRIWSLTTNKNALSVHLAVDPDHNSQIILRRARNSLKRNFDIQEVTIQVEDYVQDMADCEKCRDPLD